MGLAERLSTPVQTGTRYCSVGKALDRLDGADHAALVAALQDHTGWPATVLAHALQLEGINVDVRHIRQHRNGHTGCDHPSVGRI